MTNSILLQRRIGSTLWTAAAKVVEVDEQSGDLYVLNEDGMVDERVACQRWHQVTVKDERGTVTFGMVNKEYRH